MTVLDEIVAGVREDLVQREAATPLAAVKERAGRVTEAKDCISRLRVSDAVTVIAEVKRSSPSRGSLASIADPAALALEYEKGGAAVISVLTEQRKFNGSLADLDSVLDSWLATHADGTACVIGDPSFRETSRVRSLTPELSKGLEFDLVVLIDPEAFGEGVEGGVDRYVAMTRATQRLVILTGS